MAAKSKPLYITAHASEIAYLAGLFDGEGSIGINKSVVRLASGRQTIRYQARLQMQMIDREPVAMFAKAFGVKVYVWRKQPNFNGDITTVYKIHVHSAYATNVIAALLPFMHCPHKIANGHLCIELQERVHARGGGRISGPHPGFIRGRNGLSDAELAARESLYRRARANNSGLGVRLHAEAA